MLYFLKRSTIENELWSSMCVWKFGGFCSFGKTDDGN